MSQDATLIYEFLPEDLRLRLVAEVESSDIRKREYWLDDLGKEDVPLAVLEAKRVAEKRLGLRFNFGILKWYRLDDKYESQAYEVHRDPPHLTSIPLVLLTVKGEADLVYWTPEGDERFVRCVPNLGVLLDGNLLHKITPPMGEERVRYLLFLGWDSTRT